MTEHILERDSEGQLYIVKLGTAPNEVTCQPLKEETKSVEPTLRSSGKNRSKTSKKYVTDKNRKVIFKKQWLEEIGKCAYCGKQLYWYGAVESFDNAISIDHVVPSSRGGRNVESNWLCVCYPCNQAKGNRSVRGYRAEIGSLWIEEQGLIERLERFGEVVWRTTE